MSTLTPSLTHSLTPGLTRGLAPGLAPGLTSRLAGPLPRPATAVPRPSRTRRETPVRLTRRGRRVVVALAGGALAVSASTVALVVVTGLAAVLAGPAAATGSATPAPPGASAGALVVSPGDTLWDIALDVAPRADPRDTVHELLRLNGLTDPRQLRAGTRLVLPPDA